MWAILGKAVQGFLTLVIAAIAVGIGYQQYIVNDRQHRLALFEKRMAIYNRTKEFIAEAVNKRPVVTTVDCLNFARETRDHEFLFGQEIKDFIDKLFKQGVNLDTSYVVKNFVEHTEIMNWFVNQMGVATELFKKYVDFRKP